jgi:hypothetical protein
MTQERIQQFLQLFYESYTDTCFQSCEVFLEDGSSFTVDKSEVCNFLIQHIDIYVEHTDYSKEYATIYNSSLFHSNRTSKPEEFNKFQIFLIENIQLFFHTILEAAYTKKYMSKRIKKIKLSMKLIDNQEVNLLDIINQTEERMKGMQMIPPSQG